MFSNLQKNDKELVFNVYYNYRYYSVFEIIYSQLHNVYALIREHVYCQK